MTEQDPMVGRVALGRYRIVKALAKGGMGVVYLARTEGASGFSKPFVVKRMVTDVHVDASMLKMFVREARLMSQLRHPGLVGVVDFGQEENDYLMVLEYVHGFHLGQWHRFTRQARGPFPVTLALQIVILVLDALEYAHTVTDPSGRCLDVIHRDVSPSNILIDVEGPVKLADFGVARSSEHTEHTEETTIKGKMPYLAPELFRLARPTAASDVYATAVVLHEILSGRNEFRTGDMATTVSRVLEHSAERLDDLREDISPDLADIVDRSLAKDPELRYQSAAELARDLRAVRGVPEEDANALVRQAARQDFLRPEFPRLLGLLSLQDRDEAWRNPPLEVLGAAPRNSSSPPTMAQTPASLQIDVTTTTPVPDAASASTAPGRSPNQALVWAAPISVALIVASVLLVWAIRSTPATAPIIYTSTSNPPVPVSDLSTPSGDEPEVLGPGPAMMPRSTLPDAPDMVPEVDPPTPDRGMAPGMAPERPPRRRSTPAELTQAFQRRQGSVIACFQRHPIETNTATLRFALRFTVGERGEVTNVTLQNNPAVAASPAGRCVLAQAQQVRFARQPDSFTFAIPVQIQAQRR